MKPDCIGRYQILQELGRGGMGVVYRAHDPLTGRDVALKLLLGLAEAEDRARFVREGKLAASVLHPNVTRVLDVGEDQGRLFLVQELIPGGTLADRIRTQGALPPQEAAELVAQVARGLAAAHAVGVLHRDLKPENVLLDALGVPHLADFGLARRLERGQSLTASGAVLGTPAYMAPEQALGDHDRVDVRTDVYGLGVVLYELLCGLRPFRGRSMIDTLRAVVEDPIPPPSAHGPVPPALEAICMRCLAKAPEDRFPTPAALAEALEETLDEGSSPQRSPALRLVGVAAGGLLLLALGASVWATYAQIKTTAVAEAEAARAEAEAARAEAEAARAKAEAAARAEVEAQRAKIGAPARAAQVRRLIDRARVLMTEAKGQASYDALQEALKLDPTNLEARAHSLGALRSLGRERESVRAARKLLAANPGNLTIAKHLGLALQALGRFDEFLALTLEMVRAHPSEPAAHQYNGMALFELRQFPQALTALNTSIRLSPTRKAWIWRARVKGHLRQFTAALADLDEVAASSAADTDYFAVRALVLQRLGRGDEALVALARAKALAPMPATVLATEVDLRLIRKELALALSAVTELLKVYPNRIPPRVQRGKLLIKLERHEEALAEFERALKLDPKHEQAWVGRIVALRELKRLASAETAATALLEHDPTNTSFALLLGQIIVERVNRLRLRGASGAAKSAAQRGQRVLTPHLGPSSKSSALHRLHYQLCSAAGDPRAGLASLDRIVELDPTPASRYLRLRYLVGHRLDDELAVRHGRAALRLSPQHHGIKLTLADVLIRRGEREEAALLAQEVVDSTAAEPLKERARRLLKTLRQPSPRQQR